MNIENNKSLHCTCCHSEFAGDDYPDWNYEEDGGPTGFGMCGTCNCDMCGCWQWYEYGGVDIAEECKYDGCEEAHRYTGV